MSINFYIVAYSIIALVFGITLVALGFSGYNKRVLKKSYLDTKLYIYIVAISAIFYFATIFYSASSNYASNVSYIIFAVIFLAYCIAIMLMLILSLRPLKRIEDSTRELAKGKKNLNIDFEGAIEFDNIAKNLENIQKKYRENDRKLNKKDIEYQKFLVKDYLDFFGKKIEELKVGDSAQTKLCTLFCDLRNSNFSSETLTLQDNFELIKDFLNPITKAIRQNGGFVDKFMGDGVVAVFKDEDDALNASNEIAKQLDYKNLVSVGKEPIKFGLSLNSGMCIIGIVGDNRQKQFSVVGDVVNLCSRIEGGCTPLKCFRPG